MKQRVIGMKSIGLVVGMFITALITMPAFAGVLTGTVKDTDGKSLKGVLVRVTDEVSGISECVYTNARGKYTLATRLEGEMKLRVRLPYFRDAMATVVLKSYSESQKDMVMEAMTEEVEISESLPAAYHFGSLPFETGEDASFNRLQFQRDCLSCHQIGNPFTRILRTPESWAESIERMHRYLGNFDMELRDARSVNLSEGFRGEPLSVRPQFPLDESLSRTKIYEYRLETAYVPHDAIYNPNDGLIYTVDQGLDHMAITDPATGQTEYVTQTEGEAMTYRAGVEGDNHVFGEFEPGGRHGPHSLDMGLDGKYYTTNTASRSIGVFNTITRQWEASHRMNPKTKARYPHTIRFDRKGIAWFTLTGSEQVGRLDPTTGEFKILNLPKRKPMGIAGTTQPYGIDINPIDDSVWYGRLFADVIGRIDPDSFEILEYETPISGPRRMRFDKQGVLWVAGYSEGKLLRVETEGFKTKVYSMPGFAPGYRPAPYALGVHPKTQEIWINENMTDRMYKFIPEEERFVVYPIPLQGTYTRDMTFDDEGRIITSNNPLPTPALEGGVLEIICIDPDYDADEEARLVLSRP